MPSSDQQRLQFEHWVRAFAPELYRFAYRLTGKREVAEDLLQETFVEAWRSIASQREPDRARAWLFQILRYRFAHLIRDSKHRLQPSSVSMEALDSHPSVPTLPPLEILANKEALESALNMLTLPLKETFLMVFMAGYTCRETAEALHIPLGTVLSRLDRARQILRAALANHRETHLPRPQSIDPLPSGGTVPNV